jgi:hypothetical protein
MFKRISLLACILVICLGVLSCQKLQPPIPQSSQLRIETLKAMDSLPAEYGNLVAVTIDNSTPGWAQLWFEKPDKTIVIAAVRWEKGVLREKVVFIPRK